MNDYAAVPNEYRVPEYNPAGDSGNGYAGTVTPGAVANQVKSSTGSGNNPYADILKYLPRATSTGTPQLDDGSGGTPVPPDQATPVNSSRSRAVVPPAAPPTLPQGAPKPQNTEDPFVAAKWYATFPGYEKVTAADVNAYRGNPQGMTFADWYQKTGGAGGLGAPKPPGTEDPFEAAKWYRTFPGFEGVTKEDVDEYRGNPGGMDFATWYMKKYNVGQAGGQAPHQTPPPPVTPPTTPPPATTPDGGPPPSGTPPSYGGASAPPPPVAATPSASAPMSSDYAGILEQLHKLMNGQFDFEQNQLNRRMNAQAAVTGDINSGGFGEVSGRANAQLAADQGNRLSGYLNTDWQSALDRALQTYGINTQAGTARDVANIGASATGAAAGAAAGASRYASDIGLQEAMLRDKTSRYQGDQQYDLGLAGLGLDKYKFDNPNINALLGYYLQMSPEQLAMYASNPQLFPGYAYTPHP